ncbi:MAG: hypothetical protein LAN71_13060 [Acidobacteriia bacterium]|nr:hypothetical protein [Terriglobia bacterium]
MSNRFVSAVKSIARLACLFSAGIVFLSLLATPALALPSPKEKNPEGPGFVTEITAPESDVLQAVQAVVRDHIVHGTYQFEHEKTLTGAAEAASSSYYGKWEGEGKVFYKVRTEVIAPRHFKESGDIGTITVRYIVQTLIPQRTRLRIDAVFIQTARRSAHASDGTVESSEYKAIQEVLQASQLQAQEAEEARAKREQEEAARQLQQRNRAEAAAGLEAAQSSVQDLEKRVRGLRHQLEARIKDPGAPLKSAPFQSAASLQPLTAYTEVVLLIVTPYWYGIETPNGQRGWVRRDQVEPLP